MLLVSESCGFCVENWTTFADFARERHNQERPVVVVVRGYRRWVETVASQVESGEFDLVRDPSGSVMSSLGVRYVPSVVAVARSPDGPPTVAVSYRLSRYKIINRMREVALAW